MKIVLAIAAGFALGYVVAKKHLEDTYLNLANEEAARADAHYKEKWEKRGDEARQAKMDIVEEARSAMSGVKTWGDLSTDDMDPDALAEAAQALTSYQTGEVKTVEFNSYIITPDEFLIGERDYTQISLTYYEGDKVLAGGNDEAFDTGEVEKAVGWGNLTRFGEKSDDPNSIYIRNETLETDFEIVRSPGLYAVEVLGLDPTTGDNA
jgi:hypothetical protein